MTAQNKKTEIKIDLENLFDWICVQIGFDKEGKEIQKAIKLFNQQFILEELAGEKKYHYVGDYGNHRFYTEVLNTIPEAIKVENKDAEETFAELLTK